MLELCSDFNYDDGNKMKIKIIEKDKYDKNDFKIIY